MSWILTNSGKKLDYLNPQPNQIDINDIAIGLSRECRFAGQSGPFYSVAQHCVLASQIVTRDYQPEMAMEALLHDAAEAYCKDIPAPLKRLLPEYREIENRVITAIRRKYGLPEKESEAVKRADMILRLTEKRDLMPKDDSDWGIPNTLRPLAKPIRAVSSVVACNMFLRRFIQLTEK